MTPQGGSLLPPRPNLDPEPLDSARPITSASIALWVTAILAFLFFGAIVRRRWRKPVSRYAVPSEKHFDSSTTSPADRLAALAASVRESLARGFGEIIRARTTEEITTDLELSKGLGTEDFARLTAFLSATDVVKFAERTPDDAQGLVDFWSAWVAEFVGKAGAKSIIKGK